MTRLVLVAAMLAAGCVHTPQTTSAPASVGVDTAIVGRLIREGMQHSHVAQDLEYLADVIGPRLTGSAGMRRANEWTALQFHAYGMDVVRLERWQFGIGWERGPMTVRMLAPQRRELLGASWGWSPGTDGPLAGDVVFVDPRTQDEFDRRFTGKIRGAWVMGPGVPMSLLVREGAAGVVRDGAKELGLLTMSGSPSAISPLPQIVVAKEVYAQFQRLLERKERVRIEVDARNTFTRDTLQQFNTVAELRGTERPDEVVLLGAHLDSWDLGTGATDNGAGSITVLEAARILKAAGVRPKRTIRFALFSGEEEGLLGSQAYAQSHEAELAKFQAVLVLDNGTGRITGMALQGHDELANLWTTLFAPLAALGPFAVRSGNKGGTDHLSFIPAGVPSFNYDQLPRGDEHTHHSQVDVFDYAVPADIAQAATVMAVNAWLLADLPQLLARGRR
jgi:carboxypeptidase Q